MLLLRLPRGFSIAVGGIRGSGELKRLVTGSEGAWAVSFCMFPVTVEQVMNVADAEQLMPPKVMNIRHNVFFFLYLVRTFLRVFCRSFFFWGGGIIVCFSCSFSFVFFVWSFFLYFHFVFCGVHFVMALLFFLVPGSF